MTHSNKLSQQDHDEIERILKGLKAGLEDLATQQSFVLSRFFIQPAYLNDPLSQEMGIIIKLKPRMEQS